MPQTLCRLCATPLPAQTLLHFHDMPCAAQNLPDQAQLAQDNGIDLEIFQCPACGLVQTCHAPVPYYREVIRAAAFSDEMKAFRRQQFTAFVERYKLRSKRLLEIGCGHGEYLALLNEAGLDACGLEYGEAAIEHCKKQGLQVSRGFIERADQSLECALFDAFASFNFLEHWPDPRASLRGIAHNLHEHAFGLIEVPNFDMILRHKLFTEFISDHVSYYTQSTLTALLQLSGFEVLECTTVWHDYILSAVVRKRSAYNIEGFNAARQQLQHSLHDFVQQHGADGIAIWGAGHQALASIALLELAPHIRYVVDSAPFKQGKYTPATHLAIAAPERLDSDPVGAIIVMAASYSDEVARIIRQRWGRRFQLAILREHGLEVLQHGA